jgi:hypothetical protein
MLIVNVVLAIGFCVAQALWKDAHLREAAGMLGVVAAVISLLLAVVENYLYKKKRGWWYRRRHGGVGTSKGDSRRDDRPPFKRTRPTDGEFSRDLAKSRTRLFNALPAGDLVSRASIMRTVAERLEAEGKRVAAKRCQALIEERYGKKPAG